MATTLRRPTPAQKRLLVEMVRDYNRQGRALRSNDVGSPSTVGHLIAKGYVTSETVYGPRGGRTYLYTPTQAALDYVEKYDRPFTNAAAVVNAYFDRHHGTKNAHKHAKVEGWAPLPGHLVGKGYGNDFRPLRHADVFSPGGLRRTFGLGYTTIAVTVHSNDYDRDVTADFSIGELMRAEGLAS